MSPVPFAVESQELEDGIRAFAVRGELDMSTTPDLQRRLDQALDGGGRSIVLDLSECEFIDSTGIALIVRAWQRLDGNGDGGKGRLVLCCVNHQVRRLLEITGVEGSIAMHEQRDDAVAALRG